MLFEDARVLEFPSRDGRWGLAALDAGAAHVVCVEALPRLAAKAARTFADFGVSRELYEFINADIFEGVGCFEPEFVRFDHVREVFRAFGSTSELPGTASAAAEIRHSRYSGCARPRSRSSLCAYDTGTGRATAMRQDGYSGSIVATPSDGLITFMCDFFGFHCHSIDWQGMGITDWTGLHDYERGRRRTYVLELAR